MAAREKLAIEETRIPELRELGRRLRCLTGWDIIRVPGYVTPRSFFLLMSEKLFPCSDLLRDASELEYATEPDMWHDVMGHLPMLVDPALNEFYRLFGRIGVEVRSEEQLTVLNKVYWFSMEFGLINAAATPASAGPPSACRAYGAALLTGASELVAGIGNRSVRKKPFSIEGICEMPTKVHERNSVLFEVPSLEEVSRQLTRWATKERLFGRSAHSGPSKKGQQQ